MRVAFFIDGFNLYHSIARAEYPRRYKWLNLHALCQRFLEADETAEHVFYYTALAQWDQGKMARHQLYMRALRSSGVIVKKGHFNPRTKHIRVNDTLVLRHYTHEEKRSDVALAVDLVKLAYENQFDTGVVVSADGDMAPAIETVMTRFHDKTIRIIFPPNRSSKPLTRLGCGVKRMIDIDVKQSLFPNPLLLPSGKSLARPSEWS